MVKDDVLRTSTESLRSLDVMQKSLEAEQIDFEQIVTAGSADVPSNLDAIDLAACVTFGVIGTVINNNKSIKEFLNNIHADATEKNPGTLLGKLLHHTRDNSDAVPVDVNGKIKRKFVNRSAKKMGDIYVPGLKGGGPHRVMWGHDIFSIGPDNPFYLLISQYGFGRGIFQAFRHLIADTCSHQGLPLPTHSFFDQIIERADGTKSMGNKLLIFADRINKEVGNSNQGSFNNEAFNSLFSIHMQDIAAKGLTWGLTKGYILARGIKNEMRITQLHFVATFINFYFNTFWGVFKTGIPKINWLMLASLVKLTAQLFIKSNRETAALQRITSDIVSSNMELEKRVMATGEWFPTHPDPWEYFEDYNRELDDMADLIGFLEEGE